MKFSIVKGCLALVIATTSIPVGEVLTLAQTSSGSVATVASAGTLDIGRDHFINVQAQRVPLERLRIVCVTFHKFSGIKVIDQATGQTIAHTVNIGFEEITITFNKPIPVGETVRVVMENSTVRGIGEGITVPYRIFAYSNTFGEIPIGTALVRTPSKD